MKLETVETEIDTYKDVKAIAKRWYTEQRGRRLGNTVAWDDLPDIWQQRIIHIVEDTLVTFYACMKPEPTPAEKRQCETN